MCENFNLSFEHFSTERLICMFVCFTLCYVASVKEPEGFLFCLLTVWPGPTWSLGLEDPMENRGVGWRSSCWFLLTCTDSFQNEGRALSKSDVSPGWVQIGSQAVFRLRFQALAFTNLVLAGERRVPIWIYPIASWSIYAHSPCLPSFYFSVFGSTQKQENFYLSSFILSGS